jgi:hypothetical protein
MPRAAPVTIATLPSHNPVIAASNRRLADRRRRIAAPNTLARPKQSEKFFPAFCSATVQVEKLELTPFCIVDGAVRRGELP